MRFGNPNHRPVVRGFTLVDLLVSMAVILVLIGILTPAVRMARNAAFRGACSSNVRQLGLASQMFAFDRSGRVPTSVFSGNPETSGSIASNFQLAPQETVMLRINASNALYAGSKNTKFKEQWDGLGKLHQFEYVDAPEVFYCPRQTSEHTIDAYRERFNGAPGEIAGNYQLRLPDPKKYLSDLDPAMAIVSNSMRSPEEYSHKTGNNMLLADMSVQWFADGARLMGYLFPAGGRESRGDTDYFDKAWTFLDRRLVPVEEIETTGPRADDSTPGADQVDKTKKASNG